MDSITIGGIIGLIVIIAAVYCYLKFCKPSDEDEEAALEFIQGYQSVFESIIDEIIETIDITSYKSIEEFEADVFAIAYEKCWQYTETATQEALSNSTIGKLVAKCVTQENVEAFVKAIIDEYYETKMEACYVGRWEQTNAEAVEEDHKLQHEADLYEAEEKVVPEYVAPKEEVVIENIVPQRDEEEAYDSEDSGMEIIEEEDDTI